jgi:hypothetical protein
MGKCKYKSSGILICHLMPKSENKMRYHMNPAMHASRIIPDYVYREKGAPLNDIRIELLQEIKDTLGWSKYRRPDSSSLKVELVIGHWAIKPNPESMTRTISLKAFAFIKPPTLPRINEAVRIKPPWGAWEPLNAYGQQLGWVRV